MYYKSTLNNGIRVVSEHLPYVKSITLGVWIGTGSRSEEALNHGISHFIEHMMFKGTKARSAKSIAETVDAIGGQLNAFTAKEHTCYYIKVLDTHIDLAMEILGDMLLESKFDAEDIVKEREVVLEEVHMYEDTPDELVHDIHLEKVWSGHSLGQNILGTISSINQFDRVLLKEHYQQHYTPDNIVIAAAGNITHERLAELANLYFGNMKGHKLIKKTQPPMITPMRTLHDKKTEQIHLCLSTAGISNSSPDIYPMHIINNILGGGISSRLFQSIREEQGLAYSVYSYQTNYSDGGLFTVYAGTRPGNAVQVIDLIFDNINKMKKTGISKEELIKSKEQLKGSMLLGLESSSSRMSRLGKLEITLGKHITLEEVVEKIDNVSLEALQQILENLFDNNSLSLTVLGPANKEIENAIKRI